MQIPININTQGGVTGGSAVADQMAELRAKIQRLEAMVQQQTGSASTVYRSNPNMGNPPAMPMGGGSAMAGMDRTSQPAGKSAMGGGMMPASGGMAMMMDKMDNITGMMSEMRGGMGGGGMGLETMDKMGGRAMPAGAPAAGMSGGGMGRMAMDKMEMAGMNTKDHVQANVAADYTSVVIEVDPTALGEPRRKEPQTLKTTLSEPEPTPSYGPSRLLHDFRFAMNAIGDDAQSCYNHALGALRNDAEQVVPEIDRALQSTPQQDFSSRWALVYTAVKMKHSTTLHFLRNLVLAPLPMKVPADGHSRSLLAEETMLRATAVEGIEHLAVSGNEDALQTLFLAIGQASRSIRIAAVQGILATPGGERLRDRVAAMLPEEHLFMLDINRMDVRDVPQIDDPRQFLKPGVLRRMPSAPPLSGSMQRRTARPQATGQNTGAPKLQKGKK